MTTKTNSHDDYFSTCGKKGRPISDRTVIDAHAHLGLIANFPHTDSSVEGFVKVMDRIGIDKACISCTQAMHGLHKQGNDMILDAVKRYPDRFIGYMSISAGYPEVMLAELERCYDAGLRAVKIWSYGTLKGLAYDHENYQIAFKFADEHELAILAHTWGQELDELQQAFDEYGNIKWLLAHTGSDSLEKYIRAANEYENIYLETCLSSAPRGLIEEIVSAVPLHKILWGSDQIFMSATHQIGRVLFAQITSEEKAAVVGANAVKFFGIPK